MKADNANGWGLHDFNGDGWLGDLPDRRRQPLRRREADTDDWFADLGGDEQVLSDDKVDCNRRFLD